MRNSGPCMAASSSSDTEGIENSAIKLPDTPEKLPPPIRVFSCLRLSFLLRIRLLFSILRAERSISARDTCRKLSGFPAASSRA